MLGPEDLVFCSGTLLKGSIQEMVEAAVAGGYQALTLWPQDVDRAHAEGFSDADLRKLLADHDLVVADLDPLLDWTPQATPKGGEARFGVPSEDEFYAIAESLGATSLNVVQGFGAELDLDRAAEDLAGVCDRAKEHGLIITIEFLPWSGIPDVATAYDLIQRTSRDNATILVDTWHFFRGTSTLDQLRAVPGDKVGSTQFNDAPAEPAEDIMTETIEGRLLPGEGVIPIVDIIRVLDEIGSQAPIGVEVFNSRHDSMAPAEVGRVTAEATRRVLAEAR
jgi:sugar phosphate isomerase/epimerase